MIELKKVGNIVVDAANFVAQQRRERRLPATAKDTGKISNSHSGAVLALCTRHCRPTSMMSICTLLVMMGT